MSKVGTREPPPSRGKLCVHDIGVLGLPHDATEDEIRDFFSNLYTLSKLDWSSQGYCYGLCG